MASLGLAVFLGYRYRTVVEQTVTTGMETVERDKYVEYRVTTSARATARVRMRVVSGPDADFYTFNFEGYGQWTAAAAGAMSRFEYIKGLSAEKTRGCDISLVLEPGAYVFVLDNSKAGGARPSAFKSADPVTAEVQITLCEVRN